MSAVLFQDFMVRSHVLLGNAGLETLHNSHVTVIGLGGVGSFCAEALGRAGIGRISLVDSDRVEYSNINRQLPALHSTVGRYKTEVMASRLQDINPLIMLDILTMRYNEQTSHDILGLEADFVVDAIDSMPDKLHLIKTCLENSQAIISSMGMANRLDPGRIKQMDLAETRVCPVARIIRRELRKSGINKPLPVVCSDEQPWPSHPDAESSESLGSVSFVPPVAGFNLAAYVVRHLLDLPLAGR